MLILVINSGSSSVKYKLFDTGQDKSIANGIIERIGQKQAELSYQNYKGKSICNREVQVYDHKSAIKLAIDLLLDKEYGIIEDINYVRAVGHRVVHGGEKFISSVVVDDNVLKTIKDYSELAPLHNPPAVKGIEAVKHVLPDMVQVAVFDTAFHHTMPEHAYIYGLPYEYYKKYNLRRYGFHGTSHKYVAIEAAKKLERPLSELRLVTCHLGNGCSITAVNCGKSIDTSMGFTPLEGLLMGTRCGDLDPAIIYYLIKKEKLSVNQIDELLNKKSGLLGISGVSNDMREVEKAAEEGNNKAKLAIKIFVYKIIKYVGSYYAVMQGLDALVFTAGIGEHESKIREYIVSGLKNILDNNKTKVLVIPTNEELMIAKETESVLKK